MTKRDKIRLAKQYRKKFIEFDAAKDQLYTKVLKELEIKDSDEAWDYFNNGFLEVQYLFEVRQ